MPPKKATPSKRKAKSSDNKSSSSSSKKNKRASSQPVATTSPVVVTTSPAVVVDLTSSSSTTTASSSTSTLLPTTHPTTTTMLPKASTQPQQQRPPNMTTTTTSTSTTTTPTNPSSSNGKEEESKKATTTVPPKAKTSPLLLATTTTETKSTPSKSLGQRFQQLQSLGKALGIWCLEHIPFLCVIVMLVFSNLPDDHQFDQDPPLLVAIGLVWYACVRLWYLLSDQSWFRRIVDPVVYASLTLALWVVQHSTLVAALILLVFSCMPEDHHLELDPPMMLAILGVWYMVQSVWSTLPDWLLEQRDDLEDDDDEYGQKAATNDGSTSTETVVAIKGLTDGTNTRTKNHKNNKTEDLTSPNTIWKKLNDMLQLTYAYTQDISLPQYKVYVCFLSLMHLLTELYLAEPDWHDDYMRSEGTAVERKELETLQLYLNFADWAYEESCTKVMAKLRTFGYQLVRHDVAVEPGRVGHFLAVHHPQRRVVLAIKGTSSLSDVLTDLVGRAVPHTLPDGTQLRCHEGMYTAAQLLLQDTQHLIENFFREYDIVVCGHSLGAGVSALLGILLKKSNILPEKSSKLQVYAFATPACLSYTASLECADYITSVVNNDDCIPRISLVTIRNLMQVFGAIDDKLKALGRSPSSWRATRNYLKDIATIDTDTLMTSSELLQLEHEFAEDDQHEHALFVPGRVVSMWKCDTSADKSAVVDCRQGTGGLSTLRHIEVSTTMISDHGTANYKETLSSLLRSGEKEEKEM